MSSRVSALGTLFLALLSGVAYAQEPPNGIDTRYEKPAGDAPWGQRLLSRLGLGEQGIGRSYALVVGISDYAAFTDLPTRNDPLRVRDFLVNDARYDVVYTLTEDKVTFDRVRAIMEDELPQVLGDNDRFLFYWSGHGLQRQVTQDRALGYLPLATSRADRYSSMFSMARIKLWNEALRAKQTLFLIDACFSGLAGVARKSSPGSPPLQRMWGPAHWLMTAGTEREETIASDALGGSLFTHAFLSGARGAADSSTSASLKDGVVSIYELIEHVKTVVDEERARSGWSKSITPQLRDLRGSDGVFFFLTDEPVQRPPEPNLPGGAWRAIPKTDILDDDDIREAEARFAALTAAIEGGRLADVEALVADSSERARFIERLFSEHERLVVSLGTTKFRRHDLSVEAPMTIVETASTNDERQDTTQSYWQFTIKIEKKGGALSPIIW